MYICFERSKHFLTDSQVEENKEYRITEEEAIKENLKKIFWDPTNKTKYGPVTFLKTIEEEIRTILQNELAKRKRKGVHLTLQIRLTKYTGGRVEVSKTLFHGRCHIILHNIDIEQVLRASIMKVINSFWNTKRKAVTGRWIKSWNSAPIL